MAKHPTAALSYGDPPPGYPHVLVGAFLSDADAVGLLQAGRSVHVVDERRARAVLVAAGLSPEQVDERIRVAEGSVALTSADLEMVGR